MQSQHVVALGKSVQPLVVGHPPTELGQFGRDTAEPLPGGQRVALLQAFGHGVELTDDRLALQATNAGRIAPAKKLHGLFQLPHVVLAQPRGSRPHRQ